MSGGVSSGTLIAFAATENKTSGIATYTFKAPSITGTKNFKVVFTSTEMADVDGKEVKSSSATATVTVKGKSSSNSGNTTSKPTTKNISFDSVDETVYATGEVNVRANYSTSSSRLGELEKGDSVTRTGIAKEYSDGILWSRVSYNGQTAYISSDFLTTTKPAKSDDKTDETDKKDEKKSSNNNLKSLKFTQLGLTPAFDPNTQEYTLTVGSNIDSIDIEAVPADEKAKVTISGNENLQLGENTIIVKVTAEDGKEQEYEIIVTKEEEVQLGLKELLVEGLPLTPEFSQTVYEYTLNLDKNDVSELNITATASKENANVEIIGNSDLKSGENVITILVSSDNEEEEVITYQLTVNIPTNQEETSGINLNSDETKKYIVIGAVALLLIIVLIVIIVKRRKNREEETDFNMTETIEKEENENKKDELDVSSEMKKLADEELPKSMRKQKEDEQANENDNKKELDDKKHKIDEFMSGVEEQEDSSPKRKKGKHF